MFEQQIEGITWRIVEEPPREEDAPRRFAVIRGERRVVWGLRDRDAAARWLHRLIRPGYTVQPGTFVSALH